MSLIPCHLSRLLIEDQADHVVFLDELAGSRRFSFIIGAYEAAAIERGLKKQSFARPLTHDLLMATITATGHRLAAVRITEERGGTYFGELVLENADGRELAIDCRPSDGLVLLTRTPEAELLVNESLLSEPEA